MEKKEYIKNKFVKDFLRYSLLQEDSLPAEAIAGKLYEVLDLDNIAVGAEREIEQVCGRFLSFDNLKTGGELSEELPEDFGPELKERIAGEFREYLDGLFTGELAATVTGRVVRRVELQCWSNGIVNMEGALELFQERLEKAAESYAHMASEPLPEQELVEKYDRAREKTLMERIQKNNSDDIIEYRNALLEYSRRRCGNMLYSGMERLCRSIASAEVFGRLLSGLRDMMDYALRLKGTVVETEPSADWDREYDRMVPTEFYRRNVEEITAEQAFQMVLLLFFANDGDWMVENGMLSDGELTVYVGADSKGIGRLLDRLLSQMEADLQ